MKKGTVLSLKNLKFTDFMAKNNILVILILLFILGLAAGTFSGLKISVLSEYSDDYLKRFISERTNATFFSVTLDSFMGSALTLLLTFAAGTSMLGVILVPTIFLLRGVLYGSVSALLYSEYSVKGIAFNAVLIIPAAIVFIISLILSSRESIKFSLIIAKMTLPGSPSPNLSADFKNYCGRYLFICLLVLASALVDAVLSCSFLDSLTL